MGKAASESQTKQNYSQLKPALDTIHGYAEQNGLQAQILRRIINAITQPNSLDLSTQKHLIKSLYPKDKVPSELIIITVGSLGHGILKASVWTQQLLLEWVTMVYDHLEEPSILSSLYSILFNLLDMTTLRAGLCHLLTIITRKKHVRPFRIQMLRDLEQSVGREPALMKLMQIFEEYAPGSLNVGKGTRRVPAFSHPDSDWGERLQRIQERAESENMGSALSSDLSRSLRKEVERGRLETLTERSNSLGEIDSLENLVTKFEDIRVSDLTIADLESPIVQQYLLLQPQEASVEGIDRCLSPLFEHLETLTSGQDISTLVSEILEKLLTYTRYSKVRLPPRGPFTVLRASDPPKLRYNLLQNLSPQMAGTARPRNYPVSFVISPSTLLHRQVFKLQSKYFSYEIRRLRHYSATPRNRPPRLYRHNHHHPAHTPNILQLPPR